MSESSSGRGNRGALPNPRSFLDALYALVAQGAMPAEQVSAVWEVYLGALSRGSTTLDPHIPLWVEYMGLIATSEVTFGKALEMFRLRLLGLGQGPGTPSPIGGTSSPAGSDSSAARAESIAAPRDPSRAPAESRGAPERPPMLVFKEQPRPPPRFSCGLERFEYPGFLKCYSVELGSHKQLKAQGISVGFVEAGFSFDAHAKFYNGATVKCKCCRFRQNIERYTFISVEREMEDMLRRKGLWSNADFMNDTFHLRADTLMEDSFDAKGNPDGRGYGSRDRSTGADVFTSDAQWESNKAQIHALARNVIPDAMSDPKKRELPETRRQSGPGQYMPFDWEIGELNDLLTEAQFEGPEGLKVGSRNSNASCIYYMFDSPRMGTPLGVKRYTYYRFQGEIKAEGADCVRVVSAVPRRREFEVSIMTFWPTGFIPQGQPGHGGMFEPTTVFDVRVEGVVPSYTGGRAVRAGSIENDMMRQPRLLGRNMEARSGSDWVNVMAAKRKETVE